MVRTYNPASFYYSDLLRAVLLFLLLLPLVLTGCEDQQLQTVKWTEYEPVYMTPEEFVNSVGMEAPRELTEPGKIYLYSNYLFINEVNEGVHIIDNSNPSSPAKVGFINIPANKDIAVKGDYLYADSNSDLLVFNIEDMQSAELVTRVNDVFSFSANQQPGILPAQPVDPTKGVVVDWKKVEREEECRGDCTTIRTGGGVFRMDALMNTGAAESGFTGPGSGVGGSMARFAITGDYLYAVDDVNLFTFNITNPEPAKISKQDVGWAIETIFPYESNLYVGSSSAMYIYDISDPASPSQMSVYTHMRACDPVVVEGDHAFVTLRENANCPGGINQLEVIDVEDPYNPEKVAFYPMINPHGLGIDNGTLFISEGEHGLKVLDASDPGNIQQLSHLKNITTYDVIPFNNVLMVTGESGLMQYDYSNVNNLQHLSTIPVNQE